MFSNGFERCGFGRCRVGSSDFERLERFSAVSSDFK